MEKDTEENRRLKVTINSAYKEVISTLINCFINGEFDARYLASEINAVPLPEAKNEQDREELEKYYAWLIKELKPEEVELTRPPIFKE